MLDGVPLIDVHTHPAALATLKLDWDTWVQSFDSAQLRELYADGVADPVRFDALLAAEGVDLALALAEYSPKVTGIQSAEDMAAVCGPRVRFVAN